MEKYTVFLSHNTLLQVFLECSKTTEILFETRYGTRSLISFAIYLNEKSFLHESVVLKVEFSGENTGFSQVPLRKYFPKFNLHNFNLISLSLCFL